MSDQISVPLMFAAVCVMACLVLMRLCVLRLGSQWLDRTDTRPSLLVGWGMVIVSCLICGTATLVPLGFLMFVAIYNVVFGAILFANGVELIRVPPTHEYRPTWYVGYGRPDWLSPAARRNWWRPRVSLTWIVAFMTVVAATATIAGYRFRHSRQVHRDHESAVQRINELGGAFQQGTVVLSGTDVVDDDLQLLSSVRGLRDLNLGATGISNSGMRYVTELKDLQALNLSGTKINDAGLVGLGQLRDLQTLRLRQTSVTGIAFRSGKWRRLANLDLSLCPVSADGVAAFGGLSGLTSLVLDQTAINSGMIESLARIRTQHLSLSRCGLTAADVERLKSMTNIPNVDGP